MINVSNEYNILKHQATLSRNENCIFRTDDYTTEETKPVEGTDSKLYDCLSYVPSNTQIKDGSCAQLIGASCCECSGQERGGCPCCLWQRSIWTFLEYEVNTKRETSRQSLWSTISMKCFASSASFGPNNCQCSKFSQSPIKHEKVSLS